MRIFFWPDDGMTFPREDFALAEAFHDARRGLISALGWVSAYGLKETVAKLLAAKGPIPREVGSPGCIMRRLDPGTMFPQAVNDPDPRLGARTLRADWATRPDSCLCPTASGRRPDRTL